MIERRIKGEYYTCCERKNKAGILYSLAGDWRPIEVLLITHPSTTIKALKGTIFFGHIIKLTSRIFSGHEALVQHHEIKIQPSNK